MPRNITQVKGSVVEAALVSYSDTLLPHLNLYNVQDVLEYLYTLIQSGLSDSFLDLTDVDETSYAGHAGSQVLVNPTADGLIFGAPPGGGDMLESVYAPSAVSGTVDKSLTIVGSGSLDYDDLNDHITDIATNPHGITPAMILAEPEIGTKNSAFNKSFSGTGVANTVARSDHNHNTSYATIATVTALTTTVNNHIGNVSNPHGVTAAQIGAATTAGLATLTTSLTNHTASALHIPAGGVAGQVLTKDTGTDYDTSWQDASGSGGIDYPPSSGYYIAQPAGWLKFFDNFGLPTINAHHDLYVDGGGVWTFMPAIIRTNPPGTVSKYGYKWDGAKFDWSVINEGIQHGASTNTYWCSYNGAWTAHPIQSDATADGTPYGRQDNAWTSVEVAGAAALVAADLTTHAALNAHLSTDERNAINAAPYAPDGTNVFITQDDLTDQLAAYAGSGDMFKATYDTDNDGIVDAAESLNNGVDSVTTADVYDHVQSGETVHDNLHIPASALRPLADHQSLNPQKTSELPDLDRKMAHTNGTVMGWTIVVLLMLFGWKRQALLAAAGMAIVTWAVLSVGLGTG